MEEILIPPPYQNCKIIKARAGQEASVSRVQKVLQGERIRLGLS